MESQRDKGKDDTKGYTPEAGDKDNVKNESQEPTQNLKWDQAQRRQQAGPRSYNESIESQNIANQNTDAENEQIDNDDSDNPNDPKEIGDQISERQQKIDEKDTPGDRKSKKKE
ncbi:MAG TPA: hypothetical protein VLN46_01610 [Gillisia sp.]|nr:hypothetical protein [Gillisia sp.]